MNSINDDDLRGFVSVLEECLLDRQILKNLDFIFCMSTYMARRGMLNKLWQRGDYQRLLSESRYVGGIAVLFHCSTQVLASTARHLQDKLTNDPNVMIRTIQKACGVKKLDALTRIARSSNEATGADTGRVSATTLLTSDQNVLPGSPGQPTAPGNSASVQSDDESSDQHDATQRQVPLESSNESTDNR